MNPRVKDVHPNDDYFAFGGQNLKRLDMNRFMFMVNIRVWKAKQKLSWTTLK